MCLWNKLSYIWNNSQHSLSFSSIQQLYKDIILQFWNPSARALCYSLNAGPQSQCFGSVLHEWTCRHRESVPSIPAHWTGCILKDSRTIQRYITTHSCTLTRTHTHGPIDRCTHEWWVPADTWQWGRGHSRETESGLKDEREGGQLFSNRDSRSSLLLLGRSGGPR